MTVNELLERLRQELALESAAHNAELERLRHGLTALRTRVMSLSITVDRHHPSWNELQSLNHFLTKLLEKG